MPTETTVLHTSEETTPTLEQLKSQLEDAKKDLKTAQDHEAEVKAPLLLKTRKMQLKLYPMHKLK